MEAVFSEEQLATLQSKIWWVACSETPFLIRFAVLNNTILLTITDLRVLWGTRVDQKKLIKDKELFAKTLELASIKQLISLFEGILSNPDQEAVYKFIKKNSGDLIFEITKEITVYPLKWKFQLIQLDCDIVGLMCKDIINPLTRTLNAQQKRFQIIKKKMQMMEKDLLKRMTETQKSYYKSPLIEDEQDLKLLVTEPKEEEFIVDIRLQNSSKFFFQRSMLGFKKLKSIPQKNNLKQKNIKVQKRVVAHHNQLNPDQIINQLEMKKQDQKEKKKKKRAVDFI